MKIICHLSFVICHLSFVICHWLLVIGNGFICRVCYGAYLRLFFRMNYQMRCNAPATAVIDQVNMKSCRALS
ncbi:MAG: hypothetical protein HEQ19_26320 [Gloeotrichia echinulata CP02]